MVGRECDCCDEQDGTYDASLDCDHTEVNVDILTGEMRCQCGYTRILTAEELKREAALQAEMMEAYYRECEDAERNGTQMP